MSSMDDRAFYDQFDRDRLSTVFALLLSDRLLSWCFAWCFECDR